MAYPLHPERNHQAQQKIDSRCTAKESGVVKCVCDFVFDCLKLYGWSHCYADCSTSIQNDTSSFLIKMERSLQRWKRAHVSPMHENREEVTERCRSSRSLSTSQSRSLQHMCEIPCTAFQKSTISGQTTCCWVPSLVESVDDHSKRTRNLYGDGLKI